jgi:S-formylglutathione hydrolase FrmB
MGGNGVFKIGLTHTDIYTSFASHMGAVPDITPYFDKIDSMPLSMLDFYLDCGRQDQMVSPSATQTAGEYLEGVNANVTWELRDGAHNSAFYMTGMPKSMKMHSDHFIRQGLN